MQVETIIITSPFLMENTPYKPSFATKKRELLSKNQMWYLFPLLDDLEEIRFLVKRSLLLLQLTTVLSNQEAILLFLETFHLQTTILASFL